MDTDEEERSDTLVGERERRTTTVTPVETLVALGFQRSPPLLKGGKKRGIGGLLASCALLDRAERERERKKDKDKDKDEGRSLSAFALCVLQSLVASFPRSIQGRGGREEGRLDPRPRACERSRGGRDLPAPFFLMEKRRREGREP